MTQVYRLCGSAYRNFPFENSLHSQLLIHISSPSTTNNEGGGWFATGPIGSVSGVALSGIVESPNSTKKAINRGLVAGDSIWLLTGDTLMSVDYTTPDDSLVDGFIGNTWITRYSFTNTEAGRVGRNTGIYYGLIPSGNEKHRCILGVYSTPGVATNSWRGWKYNIDNHTVQTVTTTLGFASVANQGAIRAEIFHNNCLYFMGATDGGVGIFDPSSMTFDTLTWPTSDIWGPHDFCPYKGKLYCANRGERGGGGGSGLYIWEITRPAPVLSLNLATAGYGAASVGTEPYEGKNVLFTDRENLILGTTVDLAGSVLYRFLRMSSPTGALQFDGSSVNTFTLDTTTRGDFFTEQNTYPDLAGNGTSDGQLMTLMLDQAGTTGTLRQQWAWQGPTNAALIEENTQGNILHTLRETARTSVKNGGGERIWNPLRGGPRVDITNYAGVSGNLRVSYTIYNNPDEFPAGTPCSIQLKWSDDYHLPYKRGRLLNPSTGTLQENNTVVVLPALSGVTNTIDWDFRAAGLETSSRPPIINLLISTTGVI